MWYQGWGGGYYENRIGYAFSSDGINWSKWVDNPVLDRGDPGEWNARGVFFPAVIYENGTYHMWYTGLLLGEHFQIGYATSPDGITWTEHPNNPILCAGSTGSWDEEAKDHYVLFDGSTFHMWYTGAYNNAVYRIGYATSPDGVNWTKYSLNPVLDLGSESWEAEGVEVGSVLLDGSTYTMWYSGFSGASWRVGYATSSSTAVVDNEDMITSEHPVDFKLEQNYPNPFNALTTIKYHIYKDIHLKLEILNITGYRIRTLVNKNHSPGMYQAVWDTQDHNGNPVSSGLYFYKIESKGYSEKRKMVFLK
jgi:predicted GH43/DUF377 family glycosyl hydrolase